MKAPTSFSDASGTRKKSFITSTSVRRRTSCGRIEAEGGGADGVEEEAVGDGAGKDEANHPGPRKGISPFHKGASTFSRSTLKS